jgi:polysaccharide biosynthesis protein PslG
MFPRKRTLTIATGTWSLKNAGRDAIERRSRFGSRAEYNRNGESLSKESAPPMVYDESVGLAPRNERPRMGMGEPMRGLAGVPCFLLVWAALGGTACCGGTEKNWLADWSIGESFGVQIQLWYAPPKQLDAIKAAGFGLLRFGIGWRDVEKHPGRYDWKEADNFIAQVRARHLRSIIIVYGGNPAYSGEMDAAKDASSPTHEKLIIAPRDDGAVQAYARFAAAAAQRYRGGDIIWEIWNEPDMDSFWAPKADPNAYAKLASAACRAMREVAPGTKIIGPAAAGAPGLKDRLGIGLWATTLSSPAGSCFDALSVHSYRVEPNKPPKTPESVMDANKAALAFIAGHTSIDRLAPPLICSEWGFSSIQVTPEQQANYALRTHLSNILSGVPVTIWYEWHDSRLGASDPEAHFGLVDYHGKDKPAIQALRDVLPLIRDDVVERRLPLADPRDYVLLLRRQDGGHALLFWTSREASEAGAYLKAGGDKAVWVTAMPQLIETGGEVPLVAITNGEGP